MCGQIYGHPFPTEAEWKAPAKLTLASFVIGPRFHMSVSLYTDWMNLYITIVCLHLNLLQKFSVCPEWSEGKRHSFVQLQDDLRHHNAVLKFTQEGEQLLYPGVIPEYLIWNWKLIQLKNLLVNSVFSGFISVDNFAEVLFTVGMLQPWSQTRLFLQLQLLIV